MTETDDEAAAPTGAATLDPSDLSGLPVDLFLFDAQSLACVASTESARRACGYDDEALTGAALSWVFPELTAEEVAQRLSGRNGAGGAAYEEADDRFETMLRCASGGYRGVILRLSRLSLRDVGYVAATFEDAESRRRVGGALAESEAVFQSILATAPDAIVVIDVDGAVAHASASAEQMFGYAPGELAGLNVSALAAPPHGERHDGYIARYLRTGEKRIIGAGRRVEALRKDGSLFPAELAVGEALIGARRLFTGFVRDISRRVEAERRANELNEKLNQAGRLAAMGEMAVAISHELNQPLTAVTNYVQAGLRYMRAPDKASEATQALEKAVAQAKRASEVVHRARGFVDHAGGERRPIDINQIVREATELALLNARSRHIADGVEIDFALADDLPPALADATQIQQVVLNLVKNALEALSSVADAARALRILVETRRVDDLGERTHVAVVIHDTGPGVADEDLARIFAPFVTTKLEGLGVGLAISRSIIDAHGGALRVERSHEGGAAFSFTLPANDPTEPTAAEKEPDADAPGGGEDGA